MVMAICNGIDGSDTTTPSTSSDGGDAAPGYYDDDQIRYAVSNDENGNE